MATGPGTKQGGVAVGNQIGPAFHCSPPSLAARTGAGPASGFLGDIQILGDEDDTTG